MEYLIEFIFEVILEGVVEGATSGRVPGYIRVILAAILFFFYGGLSALLVAIAINGRNPVLWVLAIGCILLFTVAFAVKWREVSRKRKEQKPAAEKAETSVDDKAEM